MRNFFNGSDFLYRLAENSNTPLIGERQIGEAFESAIAILYSASSPTRCTVGRCILHETRH